MLYDDGGGGDGKKISSSAYTRQCKFDGQEELVEDHRDFREVSIPLSPGLPLVA